MNLSQTRRDLSECERMGLHTILDGTNGTRDGPHTIFTVESLKFLPVLCDS